MARGRGRGRSRPRLLRMDAAVDAMLPFGFAEEKVKNHVKELLKVYGGNEGWPFIEECAYKVLIDSLLEEKYDDEEQVVQNGDPLEDVEVAEPSRAAVAEPSAPLPIPATRTRVPCNGWIESEEEGENFISLRPTSTTVGVRETRSSTKRTKRHKSTSGL